MGASVRTVGAALRGRPAWDSVLGYRRVAEIEFDAGRPRRAAPTVRPVGLDRRGVFVGEAKVSRSRWSIWPHTPCFVAGMTVATHPNSSESFERKIDHEETRFICAGRGGAIRGGDLRLAVSHG